MDKDNGTKTRMEQFEEAVGAFAKERAKLFKDHLRHTPHPWTVEIIKKAKTESETVDLEPLRKAAENAGRKAGLTPRKVSKFIEGTTNQILLHTLMHGKVKEE